MTVSLRFIRRQPGLELQRNVIVTGEVRFPGRYTLLSKDERLTDVLERTGGLTPQAYPSGIRFFRQEGAAGRISVDLLHVIVDPEHRDNLLLADADSVHIPRFIPTVRVEGAVYSPTSVAFLPGKKTDYYIDAAGGHTRTADKGRTFVQQPNGLMEKKGTHPEPGAVVVVPVKEPSERRIDLAVLFGGIGQILSAVTPITLVLNNL